MILLKGEKMKKICEEAIKLLENGDSFVQATILTSSGSVPRGKGACMLVLQDGSIIETVGGGALEAGIMKAAPEMHEKKRSIVIDMVLDGNDAVATGMICGGSATVLVDYIDAKNPGNLEFFKALLSAINKGEKAYIAFAPPTNDSTATRFQCLMPINADPRGISGIDENVLESLHTGRYHIFTRTENRLIYFLRVGTEGTAYIFGAGHCGEKLAPVLTSLGFSTVIIDDRAEFANARRFADADEIIVPESMDIPFDSIAWNENSYIIIVTRGHKHDELVLRHSLKTNAGYIGMIGSDRKRESVYSNLLADGYTQSDLDRVTSPIGLDIGAETPEEIAISIAGQLIDVRAKKQASD